jgi:hypothetical protein
MKTCLKALLQRNNCSFDKYLSKFQYIKTKDDIREELYITSVITAKQKNLIVITREIKGNWFDSIKDIEDIVLFIIKHYNYQPIKYKYIFHIYIENINFEHFYVIDIEKEKKLGKISVECFEKILAD